MNAVVVVAVVLGVPGLLPAVAVARRWVVVVFLAPLIGAGMAGVAAAVELGAGGSVAADYAVVAVLVNLTVLVNLAVPGWWLAARPGRLAARPGRGASRGARGWPVLTLAVLAGCLAVPLLALRSPMIGCDANSIWLTHTLMVYGGHHELVTGLQNVAYQFSNPDYPPLVPAAAALGFSAFGLASLHLAAEVTVLLSACALGLAGTGIAATGIGPAIAAGAAPGRTPARVAAVAAAGAVCVAAFAVSGVSQVEGYADLMWAAAAAAAVIWGLVLPPSGQALGIAWIAAADAGLTKNEGLTTALVILALIALRYRPLTMPGPAARRWAERAAFVVLPALPGLAWAALIRHIGVSDAFFKTTSGESTLTRAQATVAGIAAHLAIAPVALAVLLAGWALLRADRHRARIANPAWLWTTCLASLLILFTTYLIGAFEIHWWLSTSVARTTIFAQVLLYADLAIWLVIAADGVFARSAAGERAGQSGVEGKQREKVGPPERA
jgi:hypothetical protein